MLLASSWFGQRARNLSHQLRLAPELRFDGIALLPGTGLLEREELPPPHLLKVGAAALDALLPTADPQAPPRRLWQPERMPAVCAELVRLACPLLILPVGADLQPEARERGERLLGRLRRGEALAGDEALEELKLLDELAAERQLAELAAFLHESFRQAPGLRIALAPGPSPAALLTPGRLKLLFAELRQPGLGLWFDPPDAAARAAAGLAPPGAWLDGFGRNVFGISLHDFAAGRDGLPPGAGTVDWALIADYLPRTALRVLALAPSYSEEWLAESRSALAARRVA